MQNKKNQSWMVAFLLAILFLAAPLKAQVTIGAKDTPNATLDVRSLSTVAAVPDGIIAPKLTGDQLAAKAGAYGTNQDGALVYVTAAASAANQTGGLINVTAPGYYYYSSSSKTWTAVGKTGWFYMPATVLPTSTSDPAYNSATQIFTVDLYNSVYVPQFGLTSSASSAKAPSATTLPVLTAAQLEFFVIYFDNTVFTNVQISDTGVLTYQVNANAVATDATLMNIVFKAK
jgi:hypothetical protein